MLTQAFAPGWSGETDTNTFEKLIESDSTARQYVFESCLKNHQQFCPRCQCRKLWKLAGERWRCSQCRYSFHDLSGRWINLCRLPLNNWLRVVKYFELELSARKIAEQMDLAYNTAHKAVMTIRHAILAHADDAEALLGGKIELDESYFGGRRNGTQNHDIIKKKPVFGIREHDGRVHIEVASDVKAITLLESAIPKIRHGSLVYTGEYESYDALIFCGYRNRMMNRQVRFNGNKNNNGHECFRSWAKQRLIKHHGISPRWFPLYLKELEFRYNHRHENIFPLIIDFLCDQVPNLE